MIVLSAARMFSVWWRLGKWWTAIAVVTTQLQASLVYSTGEACLCSLWLQVVTVNGRMRRVVKRRRLSAFRLGCLH